MTKYEYATAVFDTTTFMIASKLDHAKFHAKLNEYGKEGWELVNVFSMDRASSSFEVVAIFKRPIV